MATPKQAIMRSPMVMVQMPGKLAIGPVKVHAICCEVMAKEYARQHFARQGYYPAKIYYPEGIYYVLVDYSLPANGGMFTDCVIPAKLVKQVCEPSPQSFVQIISQLNQPTGQRNDK